MNNQERTKAGLGIGVFLTLIGILVLSAMYGLSHTGVHDKISGNLPSNTNQRLIDPYPEVDNSYHDLSELEEESDRGGGESYSFVDIVLAAVLAFVLYLFFFSGKGSPPAPSPTKEKKAKK